MAAVLVGDGGEATVEGAAADLLGQAAEIGHHQHRVDRQRAGVERLVPAPFGEMGPVARVGPPGGGRQRAAGVFGGRGDRVAERPVQRRQQRLGDGMGAGQAPHGGGSVAAG